MIRWRVLGLAGVTALFVGVVTTGCGSDSDAGGSGAGQCAEFGDGCICRAEPDASEAPFQGTCSATGVGAHLGADGLCCRADGFCTCEPIVCGLSSFDGVCQCGAGLFLDSLVASCDGTAGMCCTQDTGYCYCEDGCDQRFENRLVSACNRQTAEPSCSPGMVQVTSCQ